jgi:HAD superfamily hydrolase (TIGR01509 family)
MAELRAVLLDLDGTIADSIDFFFGLTCQVLAEANVAPPPRAEVLAAIACGGTPPPLRFLPADFPDRDTFLQGVYLRLWPEWLERYGTEVHPLPGACEAVEALHRRGLALAIVTSSVGELPFLDRWQIRRYFSVIIGRGDVKQIKPHPEPLISGLSRLAVSADQALNVGDTPLDVRAGRAAGVMTIGVLTGAGTAAELQAEGARAILPSLAELPDFLEQGFSGKDPGSR